MQLAVYRPYRQASQKRIRIIGAGMPFFTSEHIKIALQRLPDSTHVLLITFLAMLRSKVPVGDDVDLMPYGSEQENSLLDSYFRAPGSTVGRPYYVPFGKRTKGYPRWKTEDYSGSSLQGMRTREYGRLLYRFEKNEKGKVIGYALRPDLASILAEPRIAALTVGNLPISAHLLAAWLYRNVDLKDHAEAIARFKTEFRIAELELEETVFATTIDPELGPIALGDTPVSDKELAELIEPNVPDEEAGPNSPPITELVASANGAPANNENPSLLNLFDVGAPPTAGGSWDIGIKTLEAAVADMRGVREAAVQALAALRAGMHVVFTGPPGSGKTQLAKRLCKAASFDPLVVTATDSWTTFETIGGYFPQYDGEKERLDFEPGVVVGSMQDARILIIDEINRADIDKAFGELFTLLAGGDVDLSYRRRKGDASGKRIRLVTGDVVPAADHVDPIHMPAWWRLIGAMNDSDKASLKRLSFAFVRRFAFIPVGIPSPSDYAALLDAAADASGLSKHRVRFIEMLKALFADDDGLASIGMAMGVAIPKTMIQQAVAELGLDPSRSDEQLLASALELYVAPQFQGWAEKHEAMLRLIRSHLDDDARASFERGLANWTGFVE
ncbi:AAA family ATPase [Sinorhizobium meliloti]|uniref:AAA family ATPase n=2 Tax=Rhizobium meliloti TaxID=382 RepID=UPI001F219A9A|nr:AAA family ATPase [Sinorhizobium meliloti]